MIRISGVANLFAVAFTGARPAQSPPLDAAFASVVDSLWSVFIIEANGI
jgi:hypothetical protein